MALVDDEAKLALWCYSKPDEAAAEIERLREALKFARKRIVYYGTISDRRHFDHDLAQIYPKTDAALTNGNQ